MWDNFKSILTDDTIFYGLVIGFVALASFGLGRLSVESKAINNNYLAPLGTASLGVVSQSIPQNGSTSTQITEKEAVVSRETLYVGSKNSDKYHLPWCSGAMRIAEANKVFFNSKEEAEIAGYKPAANCKGI